jgi:hypothetical protein
VRDTNLSGVAMLDYGPGFLDVSATRLAHVADERGSDGDLWLGLQTIFGLAFCFVTRL